MKVATSKVEDGEYVLVQNDREQLALGLHGFDRNRAERAVELSLCIEYHGVCLDVIQNEFASIADAVVFEHTDSALTSLLGSLEVGIGRGNRLRQELWVELPLLLLALSSNEREQLVLVVGAANVNAVSKRGLRQNTEQTRAHRAEFKSRVTVAICSSRCEMAACICSLSAASLGAQ